ncbi:MAG: NADH-quinone oxidoreductase subunit NuoK [Phycisphaeraceae bacterium]|nr:MAG: NADH-quinone oxidoreductase subunit NuoK [Phycisphaeraceae bacterium]
MHALLADSTLTGGLLTLAQSDFPHALSTLTLNHYLFVSAAMFALGIIGFLTRRNLIIMFLCTELMFQAAGLALIAFGRYHLNFDGQSFVIFVLTIAAAEAAMALALVVLLFRRRESLDADLWAELKG